MGEYKAVKNRERRCYDVALVVTTPKGKRKYLFGKQLKTMKEAKEIADLFNKEVGVTA